MRYFYYYRSILGRWAPCLDTNYPGKGAERNAPKLAYEVIRIADSKMTLDDCIRLYPDPNKRPEEPEAEPVTPPDPKPDTDDPFAFFNTKA